jgi:hypothetical protein
MGFRYSINKINHKISNKIKDIFLTKIERTVFIDQAGGFKKGTNMFLSRTTNVHSSPSLFTLPIGGNSSLSDKSPPSGLSSLPHGMLGLIFLAIFFWELP